MLRRAAKNVTKNGLTMDDVRAESIYGRKIVVDARHSEDVQVEAKSWRSW